MERNGTQSDGASGLCGEPVLGVESHDGAVVVRLGGELDLHNAGDVRDALFRIAGEDPARIVVDLSQVEFIDSTALGVLIEARTKLPNGRAFLLASPQLDAKRALAVSGIDRHLPVHESLDDALGAVV